MTAAYDPHAGSIEAARHILALNALDAARTPAEVAAAEARVAETEAEFRDASARAEAARLAFLAAVA